MKILRFGLVLVTFLATSIASFAIIGAPYQMQLGNPSSATTTTTNHDHYLIQRDQYAMDYSDVNGEPNWVSWDLTTGDVGGSGRSDFIVDTTLPAGFYQVLTTDYSGSGYDRGHMCPSADRTITHADNQILFYMSNMVPQAPDNNQGVWANFESYCRTLAAAGNELLITSGPSGFSGSRVPSGAAAIPGYVWKIVLVVPNGAGMAIDRVTPSTRVIAIKIPNVAGVRSDPWQNYITSASVIEADTGFHFFTALAPSLASVLRTVVDGETASGVPTITTQPTTTTTVLGGSATFSVVAAGTGPFSYQWFKDDVAIDGANNSSITIAGALATDAGLYDVVVSNASGSVTSSAASLIISGIPPSITSQPSSTTVSAGTNVTLAVTASGSPTLTYQWRKDFSPLAGATGSALVIHDAQSANAGSYDVVVTNSVNSATSSAASVVVNPAGPTITVQPASLTTAINGTATFSVTAVGTEPLSYQWRKGGSELLGATASTLVLAGVSATTAGSYDVVVHNSIADATSSPAVLTVTAATPSTVYWNFTTADPTSGLPADVTGGTFSQGNNNGTTTLITAVSVSSGYAGVSAGNNAGAAARVGVLNKAASGSAYFEFTLTPNAGKSLQATGLSFGTRSTSTGPQAYAVFSSLDSFTTPIASGAINPNSSWNLFTPSMTSVTGTDGIPVTFRIYGYGGAGSAGANTANWRIDDVKLTIATLATPVTGVAPTVTSTNPAAGATGISASSGINLAFSAPVNVTGQWFTINSAANGTLAATVNGGPSNFTLTTPISFADNDVITVTVLAAQVTDKATNSAHLGSNYTFSFTTAASSAPVPPSILTQPVSHAAIVGDTVSFTVAAGGTAPFSYQWRKNTSPISGNATATSATLTLAGVSLGDTGSYDCVVTNVAGNTISSAATLTVTALPPTITSQPATQTVLAGDTTTFTVGVSGTAPFAYQWSKGGAPLVDGNGISGANSATLTITPTDPDDAGVYSVVVTNSVTSVASNSATLAVGTSPSSTILWNFNTATPSSGLPGDITGGAVSQGNNNGTTPLLTTTSASNGYPGFSAGNNAGAAARIGALNRNAGGSAYFEFTLSPSPASKLVTSAISFGTRSTGTGPQAFAIYTSIDGFAAPIATGTLPNTSVYVLQNPAIAPLTGGTGAPVTFRIYGYNGAGGATANTANWRIDDLSVTVRTLATPPVVTATAPVTGAVNVSVASPISITFNQAVHTNGSWVTVTSASAGPVAVTISGGPASFTLTPTAPLPYNDTILVTVTGANVTDLTSGLFAMTADYSFTFATSLPPAPIITAQSDSSTVTVGDSVTLSVTASSPVPVSYLWRKNGTPISGNASATTSLLDLGAVTTADAGSYACVVSNLGGDTTSAAAVLTVNKATATITLGQLDNVYDGLSKAANVVTAPANLDVTVTYNGSATLPVNAGSYAVEATVNDANYEGSTTATLVIHPALAVVTLSNLSQTFDGAGKSVGVGTSPGGVSFAITYPGGVLPVNAGSYAVSVNITDPNYTGSAAGTLVINPASASLVLSNLTQTYNGAAKPITVNASPVGVAYSVTYPGGSAPVNAGSYAVSATVTDPNYTGSATGTLVIERAAATVTLGNLNQVYDGSPKSISAITSPSGVAVTITYSTGTPPIAAGSYAVAATVTDPNYTGSSTGTLVISSMPTTISLAKLRQAYNGTPRPVDVIVSPSSITYTVTYNGSGTVPTLPGTYAVIATLTDPNYTGSASGVLEITITALVNHPSALNGSLDGSMQVLLGESFALNGNSTITGDLLLPGTPTIKKNGNATYGVLIDGSGTPAPTNYTLTLNGNVVVARLLRRVAPIAMPVVAAPPSPTGTRSVSVNKAGQAIGDFATLRDLTLNGNPGIVSVPAGTYGSFTANGGGFALGVAGATVPSVYSFQNITINGNAVIQVVGPVVIKLANGVSFNGSVGTSGHPEWLTLEVGNGSVTLNGNVSFYGTVIAPRGTVTINGNSKIVGRVTCDRLVINGNGLLDDAED